LSIDAEKFKNSDEAFSKKFEARQQLESYISRVEEIVSDPTMSLKLKRGTKDKIESALSDAMAQLEVEDSTSDDLKKKELALKRVVTKAVSIFISFFARLDSGGTFLLSPSGHVILLLHDISRIKPILTVKFRCQPARLPLHLQNKWSNWEGC
jgi:hypothetical protein